MTKYDLRGASQGRKPIESQSGFAMHATMFASLFSIWNKLVICQSVQCRVNKEHLFHYVYICTRHNQALRQQVDS